MGIPLQGGSPRGGHLSDHKSATRTPTTHKGAKGGQPKGDSATAVTPRGGHLSDQLYTPALVYITTSTYTRW